MTQLEMFDEATAATEPTEAPPLLSTQAAPSTPAPCAVCEPPVLVTEHEVMFGTAAAARPRGKSITRWLHGALHSVAETIGPPPPKPIYDGRPTYIERAAMSREMDRL